MMIRDGPGFGIYFLGFEMLKRRFGVSEVDRIEHGYHGLTEWQVAVRKFFSGGIAGCLTWTIAYPADTIKTKLQTVKNQSDMGAYSLFKQIVKTHGFLYLYRGIHV
jgi:hypothetical protein